MQCPRCGKPGIKNGSGRAACKACGKTWTLARQGHSPEHGWTHPVPDGYHVQGVSTLYGEDGEIKGQWVKSKADADRQRELMEAAVAALKEDVRGLAKPIKAPKRSLTRSLSVYVIGDAHFGMYSWGDETGADFDTSIASRDLRAAIDLLVDGSPASETG